MIDEVEILILCGKLTIYMVSFTYLFEAFDPVLHIEDFELLTLLAGETLSTGDIVDRWFKKFLLTEFLLA